MSAEDELHEAMSNSRLPRATLRARADAVVGRWRRRCELWWLWSWACAGIATADVLHREWVWALTAALTMAASLWQGHNQRGGMQLHLEHWRSCATCRRLLGEP